MINLQTKYMNLDLKSPIIAGSSGLMKNIDNLIKLEKAGVGAVVLNSLFEEQITNQVAETLGSSNAMYQHAEAMDYVAYFEQRHLVEQYLSHIREAKSKLTIPVIASINCNTSEEWVHFTKEIETAGADGIELNIFILPTNPLESEEDILNRYIQIVKAVKNNINIPLAVKMSAYFSNITRVSQKLSHLGVDSIVLFNRLYSPDVDIDNLQITSASAYTSENSYNKSLRWIALVEPIVDCDLAASHGVHSGETAIKMILTGAKAVQVASVLYTKGLDFVQQMNNRIEEWMQEKNFESLDDFRGKLSSSEKVNAELFERAQFMKYFSMHK